MDIFRRGKEVMNGTDKLKGNERRNEDNERIGTKGEKQRTGMKGIPTS